jgi:hypothetical protein
LQLLAVRRTPWGLPREGWAWVAIALGVGLLWPSSSSLYYGLVSSGWRMTDATVTYSTLRSERRWRDVDIRYTYVIDGHQYKGDRWRYSFFINRQRVRAIAMSATQAAYPVGTRTRVAVDPRNPARSVLEPGAHYDDLLWIGGGLMFALTGLLSGRKDDASPAAAARKATAANAIRSGSARYRAAAVLASIGVLILSLGLYRIYDGMVSASWPTVEGHVLYSKTGSGNSAGNYQTEIRYEYFMAGRRFSGAASLFSRHDEAVALSKAHPVGQMVMVHYDPKNPELSAIVTGINWHHSVLPIIALVFFLLAALAKGVADAERT